jgi:hypothetical protein
MAAGKPNSIGQEETPSEAKGQSASTNDPGRILGCLFGADPRATGSRTGAPATHDQEEKKAKALVCRAGPGAA